MLCLIILSILYASFFLKRECREEIKNFKKKINAKKLMIVIQILFFLFGATILIFNVKFFWLIAFLLLSVIGEFFNSYQSYSSYSSSSLSYLKFSFLLFSFLALFFLSQSLKPILTLITIIFNLIYFSLS